MFKLFSKHTTFKPKKSISKDSHQYQLHQKVKATLGSGDLTGAIKLPPGEDLNEWLAVNSIDFFNQVNLLYGSVAEFCTAQTCPVMSAGPKYEYLWADGKEVKRPLQVSAPQYTEYLMTWIQNTLDDESVFPPKLGKGVDPPKSFMPAVKNIFKRLFRVYAHIYYIHYDKMVQLAVDAHLNTAFRHFYLFIKQYDLVEKKEMVPLQHLIDRIHDREGNALK